MIENEDKSKLKRGLKNRHLQMIALGTAVGTGLFYGSTSTIAMAGPAVILSYLLGGIIIFFIVRMLGEMSVEEPVSGSFSYYASRYWCDFAGFLSGWNYWFLYVVMSMAELTAVGIYLSYWFPDLPQWVGAFICLLIITAINLVTVSAYGEIEFWMALIKISAIIFMIVFGAYLIFTDVKPFPDNFSHLWIHGGFFPNGVWGMLLATVSVLFSFGGIELIGITAGEAENPDKTIPRAINQVIYRILIFYVGTMIVLMSLWAWNEVGVEASPFVQIFENLGIPAAAHILNFVVLSAAISVFNSAIYSESRMLFGMAETSNAPKFFSKLTSRKVPMNGILISAGMTLIAVVLNYLFPGKIFMYLMSIVIGAIVVTWALIILTHLKFRHHCAAIGQKTKFPSILYPFTNYLCLIFLAGVICLMFTMSEMRLAVILMPFWIGAIWLFYKFKH
ncbi:MAG: amino acid permease [Selenomonadaceae bacterium]|nr:amino acid permease [Selenomonadaceae bacterium]